MILKESMRTHGPIVFFVFLLPLVFALCILSAAAEDTSGQTEDIRLEGKITKGDIISAVDGCAAPVAAGFSSGFYPPDFEMVNVTNDPDSGHMVLQNVTPTISPAKVVIPFTQDVYVTLLSEGSTAVSDLGWILYDDAVDDSGVFVGWDSIPHDKKHVIFHRIVDDTESFGGGDGILDVDYGNGHFPTNNEAALAAYDDGTGTPFAVDRDGQVTPQDMKKHLGRFAAGSEIVFFLSAGRDWNTAETTQVFFNKPWGPDTYGACVPDGGSPLWIDEGNRIFEKVFHVGDPVEAGICQTETNWLEAQLLDRLDARFDLHLSGEGSMKIKVGDPYPHLFGSSPTGNCNQWVLGVEDKNASSGGADMDFNDLLFLVERLNGGTAQLDPVKAITPKEGNARFTSVEVNVCDVQPADSCAGRSALTYFVSPDQGANWVEVTAWDRVRSFELDPEGAIIRGDELDPMKWTPGVPPSTCRKRSVDLIDQDVTGNRLIWKVAMSSTKANCAPAVIDVQLKAAAASNKTVSRTSPAIQANIIYAGTDETPSDTWIDQTLRGHVTARRLYDPSAPDRTLREEEPLWDAGDVLSSMNPDERKIYFPGLDVRRVEGEYLTDEKGQSLRGDGLRVTFTGFLAHSPLQATTLRIYDGRPEVFIDSEMATLKGSLGGKGCIDRFTGRWEVTFNRPPAAGVPIMATYNWYSVDRILKPFLPAEVTHDMLALSDEYVWPDGYTHDFNRDGSFDTTARQTDAAWLVRWVRGFRQPETGLKKEWLLGPINHSVPALMVPPGYPRWLYGTHVTAAERERFADFQKVHQMRPSVLFVGSADGMLHAFDAGAFRHGDNPDTPGITENRGYFRWESRNETGPHYCKDVDGTQCPNYGTGRELWAFIPANLMPQLKNNLLSGGDRAQINTPPALSDVYIDTDGDGLADSWRTVLICAAGSGAATIFCLDVTDPHNPGFLWEFGALDLLRGHSSAAGVRVGRTLDPLTGEAKWTVFIATGRVKEAGRFPAVYLLDVSSGRVLYRVVLDDAVDLDGDGTIDSLEALYGHGGVLGGPPAIVDGDNNGLVDRLYVGSDRGLMYKVNIPDDPENPIAPITHCVLNTDFTTTDGSSIPPEQHRQPIYAPPVSVVENNLTEAGEIACRIRVFFGTGDKSSMEENTPTTDSQFHFFSYMDTAEKGGCSPAKHELDWLFELDEGHRVYAPAFYSAGQLYLGTATADSEDPCAVHHAVDVDQGQLYVFDLEGLVLFKREIGNVRITPLVEDQHLYLRMHDGLQSMGSGVYNTDIHKIATPEIRIRSWEEIE